MALNKRDRFSFRWSKSELPDNDDINTQVLLLGITRFETIPSPAPAKKLHTTSGGDTKKLSHRNGNGNISDDDQEQEEKDKEESNHSSSYGSADLAIYHSIEQLNKTTGCFPLERHKSKKVISAKEPPPPPSSTQTDTVNSNAIYASKNIRLIDQKSHRNHFDRLFERFHSKRIPNKNLSVNQAKHNNNNKNSGSNSTNNEQKAFYRWLHLNRNKRLERNAKCLDDVADDRQSLRTPVIRKCSTKSNSVRKKTTKKSTKLTKFTTSATLSSSRFSSCIPYCVTGTVSRNDSIAGNSLASSLRYTEYCNKKRSGAASVTTTTASSLNIDRHCRHRSPSTPPTTPTPTTKTTSNDCLMHSHCKSNKHCNPRNKNTDNNNHNNNCSLFNNLNIMDRSVDSIGSCSLDVDAESTDFSDTSGSLNVCTPSSGKDFTREFTSRIHERCQFPNHQLSGQKQTKTVLDPNSGKISTILSQNVPPTVISPTSPVKKPSYLNLACCVNGYSNLTTYDSKFRQSINKSREVSPIRPITYAVQYNRNGDNNYLSVPIPIPINDNNTTTTTTKTNSMMDTHSVLAAEKRYFSTTSQQKTIEINGTSHDVTDNVNSNGCSKFYTRSMLHTTTATSTTNGTGNTSLALVRDVNQEFDANGKAKAKSFIQQRVERLYGPGAVTQGLYSPKKPKSDDNQETKTTTTTTISTVLVEKSQNTTFQSTKYVLEAQRNGQFNGLSNNRAVHDDENINLDSLNEALPVLRHLRPEFRAQLPTLSPKRTIAISKLNTSPISTTTQTTQPQQTATTAQQTQYTNGTAVNGKMNISTNILNNVNKQVLNGGVVSSTPSPNIDDNNDDDDDNHHVNDDDVGDDDEDNSNQSILDMQSHKQSLSAFDAPMNNTTNKNGRLTSNKSHDIENDDSRHQIESTTKGSNIVVTTHLEQLQNTPNLLATANVKPNDINKMATTNTTATSVETMDANGNHKTDQKKDGLYFLHVVQSERDRLINLAIVAEKELDELLQKGDVDEEVLGHLRSAAGKARLLATKKFKQFEGLCNDNINQITRDMPPPTPADLQGFWEMVYMQVENIDSLYAELDKMRANGWKKVVQAKPKTPIPQETKLKKRPAGGVKSGATTTATAQSASGTTKKSATAIAAAQKREAQRKQLAEMRRKNKLAMTAAINSPDSDDIIAE